MTEYCFNLTKHHSTMDQAFILCVIFKKKPKWMLTGNDQTNCTVYEDNQNRTAGRLADHFQIANKNNCVSDHRQNLHQTLLGLKRILCLVRILSLIQNLQIAFFQINDRNYSKYVKYLAGEAPNCAE
jgi:hypothetical protein